MALNFQPQSAWVIQSAGHDNILPWNNKPYRGMAVAATAAVGAQATVSIVALATARAVVMYYSTVVGSGGVLKVSACTLSDAAADQGCVYFAAPADGNGTHSNQVLLLLSPATEPAAEAEGAGAGGAAEHAKAREGRADEGTEPLGGDGGRQRKEVAAATVLVNENATVTVAVTATVVAAGPVLISGFDVWEQIPDRLPPPPSLCKR